MGVGQPHSAPLLGRCALVVVEMLIDPFVKILADLGVQRRGLLVLDVDQALQFEDAGVVVDAGDSAHLHGGERRQSGKRQRERCGVMWSWS